jgi:hypothetical protein
MGGIMMGIMNLELGNKPGVTRLTNRMKSITFAINYSISQCQPFPAAMLIYSSIDILGSLMNLDSFASAESFKTWTEDYLLLNGSFAFSKEDLWGARCGILHTMRYDSKYDARLKLIVYGFHGFEGLIKMNINPNRYVIVFIEDLFSAFLIGCKNFLDFLQKSNDPVINQNLDLLPDYFDLIPTDWINLP